MKAKLASALTAASKTPTTRPHVLPDKIALPASTKKSPQSKCTQPQVDMFRIYTLAGPTTSTSSLNSATKPASAWNVPSTTVRTPANATQPTQPVTSPDFVDLAIVILPLCICIIQRGKLGCKQNFLPNYYKPAVYTTRYGCGKFFCCRIYNFGTSDRY